MKRPSHRNTTRLRRLVARRRKHQSHVFKVELLEDRSYFSVDLGYSANIQESSYDPFFVDAPITWYFAANNFQDNIVQVRAASEAHLGNGFSFDSTPLVVADSPPQFQNLQSLSEIDCFEFDTLEFIRAQPIQTNLAIDEVICDDPLVVQERPLMTTASGRFISLSEVHSYVLNSLPTTSNLTSEASFSNAFGGLTSQLVGGVESVENKHADRTAASSNSSNHASTKSDEAVGSRLRGPLASGSPRAHIAPVRQLSIGEGEAPPSTEAAARGSQNQSTPKSPSADVQQDKPVENKPLTLVSDVEVEPEAMRTPAQREAAHAQLQTMVRLAGRAAQLAQGLDRFGWTGLVSYQIPLQARAIEVDPDARPHLAPIPDPDKSSDHSAPAISARATASRTDRWPAPTPMVLHTTRLPGWNAQHVALHLVNWENFYPAAITSSDEETTAAASAVALDTTTASQRWYLAAIPALLFIPRRVRDRLWQFTCSGSRYA